LVIPAKNTYLFQGSEVSTYEFNVEMTSGNLVGNVDFTIDVGPRLVKGVFAIEPESGFPGTTEFVIKVYDW